MLLLLPRTGAAQDAAWTDALAESRWDDALAAAAPALARRELGAALATAEARRWRGQVEVAEALLREALTWRDDPAVRAALGEILLELGRPEEAIAVLDPAVESDAPSLEARYWRAVAFARTGRPSRARLEWQDFIRAYNRGDARAASDLMLVGMATRGLALYSDANDAFDQALAAEPTNAEVRWRWAELFLEKYRPDEAVALLDEALERAPAHPMLLTLRARAELDMTYDVARAGELLERALAVSPDFPEALELLAELAIDDQDWDRAGALLDRVSARAPGRLTTLELRGAVAWLADDAAQWRAIEDEVLRIAPTHARLYWFVGEQGVRNFRYVEAMELFEQALDVDAEFWPAYVSLGIGWSRMGDDDRARAFLDRAHRADPFDQRAYNMAELFDHVMPEYVTVADEHVEGLSYRFHQREAAVLRRYIPDVAVGAFRAYVQRYGLTPAMPLSIEVLRDQATFGIRSVGLPWASQHGICFGHLVTARSPADGNFNWRMVIEHEISHVFSLTASRYRVPRWFTEGLAEYDTILTDDEWRREEDIAIATTLAHDEYIGVLELNDAFIDPDMGRILAAYYQASLLVEYLGREWGYDTLVTMLELWGASHTTPEVIEQALGIEVAELDRRFEAHLRTQMAPLLAAWLPDLGGDGLEAAREAATERPNDAAAQARLAAALVDAGLAAEAMEQAARALALDPAEPLAHYVLGMFDMASNDISGAAEHFAQVVNGGRENPELRAVLAADALTRGDLDAAETHTAAIEAVFDRSIDAARLRAEIAERRGASEARRAALARWAQLDQHDPTPALELAELLLARGDSGEAFAFAERAVEIAPFAPRVHAVLGRAAVEERRWDVARRELELELEAGPANRVATLEGLERTYRALGDTEALARVARELEGLRATPAPAEPTERRRRRR